MTKSDKGLKIIQYGAISFLVQGYSITDTAKAIGKTKRTISRWMKSPKFKKALNKSRDEMLSRTFDKHISRLDPALDKIFSIMEDSSNPPNIQLKAAQYIINHGERAIQNSQFSRKLTELEDEIEFRKKLEL